MKARAHAALIKAWADGADIESRYVDGRWTSCESPMFVAGGEYRIKPETKPDIEVFANANAYDWISFCNESMANIKFIFDGNTGKLKSAEVIK